MKKQKSNLKNKLKDVWSKFKHPLIYVSFALNILFIAIAIVGCIVPSKSNGSNTSNDSEISQIVRRKNMLNETITDLTYYQVVFTSGDLNFDATRPGNFGAKLDFISNDSEFHGLFFAYVSSYSNDVMTYQPTYNNFTSSIDAYKKSRSPRWLDSVYQTIYITGGEHVQNETVISFISTNAISVEYLPPTPPTPVDYDSVSKVFLSDSFVPSVYISNDGQFIFSGFGGHNSSITSSPFHINLDGFEFESNGLVFNRVTLLYMSLPTYVSQDGSTYVNTNDFTHYYNCEAIYYKYIDENDEQTLSVIVARPRMVVIPNSGSPMNIYDVRVPYLVWTNDNYRTLTILEDSHTPISDDNLVFDGLSSVQLLQITSNVNQSVTGLTNVTDILKGGFSSLSSILQMNILPGITIGLLLFIPLIVTIILTILKLVKK